MGLSIIGTVGVPASYGGFESLVEHLLPLETDVIVYCSSKAYAARRDEYKCAKLIYLPLDANGIQSVVYDVLSIVHSVLFTKNNLLILGVSGAIILPIVKPFCRRRKFITNIDGLEWKRSKWSNWAKRFLKFSERLAVTRSDIVVADNKEIQKYVKDEYGRASCLIPYGADHVCRPAQTRELPFALGNYAFKVCRIEPENNVHIVLESFAKNPELNLVIVGNWAKNAYGTRLREKYGDIEHIHLLDPIYEQERLDQIRAHCFIYVHGHSAGGTNPSLVEAMYLGLPIIAYDIGYNRETTEDRALYFGTAEDLQLLLRKIKKVDLDPIREEMKAIAERRYTWDIIRRQYIDLIC